MNDPHTELIGKQQQEEWQDYEQRGWIALYRAGRVNRVTHNVFRYFMGDRVVFDCACMSCFVKTLKPLYQAIHALSKLRPDAQGCRKGSYSDTEIWLVPIGRNGLTMLFPKDY